MRGPPRALRCFAAGLANRTPARRGMIKSHPVSRNNSQSYPVASKIRTNRIAPSARIMPTRAPRAGLRATLNRTPDFRVRNQQPDPIGSVRVFALCRLCEIDHGNSIRPFSDFRMDTSFAENDFLITLRVSGSSLSNLLLANVYQSDNHAAAAPP